MPDVEWGVPATPGDTILGPANYAHFYKIVSDGTRHVAPHRPIDSPDMRIGQPVGGVVPDWAAGYIPSAAGGVHDDVSSVTVRQAEEGRWIGYPAPDGSCPVTTVPVTPGDDFYRFRRHVGQAADHFDSRFVPAKINQRKATAHRLFEVAQELTPEDRDKMGNVSLKERSDNGYLWRRIHAFRAMPCGTAAHDIAWRAESAAIMALLHGHCDRCARIIDVALSHPHVEWKGYLDKELRFHAVADGSVEVIPGTTWLTPGGRHQRHRKLQRRRRILPNRRCG